MMHKILVCGGRNYSNYALVNSTLENYVHRYGADKIMVIHGCADGADKLADNWAMSRGVAVVRVPANWSFYDKSAGPRRNAWMLALEPDVVIAFPGNKGTANMISIAEKKGVFVVRITE